MLRLKALKNQINYYKNTVAESSVNVYLGYLGRDNFGDDLLYDIHKKINSEGFVPCLDTFSFQKYSNVKKVVLGGGTIINGTVYLDALKKLNVSPSITFCSGVIPGAITNEWINTLRNTLVYTRSEESAKSLIEHGIDASPYVDPGVFTSILYPSPDKPPSFEQLNFTLCPHGKSSSISEYEKILAFCDKIPKSVITLFASSYEDLEICSKLAKPFVCKIVRGWEDIESANLLLANSNLIVSTRLHPAIVAASYGVPFIMLSYEKKQMEFVNSIGATDILYSENQGITHQIEALIGSEGKLAGIKQWHERYPEFVTLFGN